jgi:BNR repeat-like domain
VHRTLAAGLIVFGLAFGVARVAREPAPPRAPAPNYTAERAELDPQSNTQVEPDSFAWGKKIVATFQSWRFVDGGAAALGWATSSDSGAHWRAGTLELGPYAAASDPVVAFDAVHRTWLIAGIGFRGRYHDVFVARSPDGFRWSAPIAAADSVDEDHDKEWLTCDNAASSPFRGRCYLAYVDTAHWMLGIRTSDDGGQTWSKPVRMQPGVAGGAFSGPVPVARPNGDLVIPYSFFGPINGEDRVAAVVSHDGGATFSQPVRIAALASADVIDSIRAPNLPSASVDAAGKLYVSWQDGRFRTAGDKNDVVLSTSTDGAHWSEPARVPLSSSRTYFLPAVAADPAISGKKANVAIAYYSMQMSPRCTTFVPGCYQKIDAWLAQSTNGGKTWQLPRKLNTQAMQIEWLAETTLGAMLGDYISVSYVRGQPIPVVALAGPPNAFGYTESIFSCQLIEPARAQAKVTSACRRPSP